MKKKNKLANKKSEKPLIQKLASVIRLLKQRNKLDDVLNHKKKWKWGEDEPYYDQPTIREAARNEDERREHARILKEWRKQNKK